MKQKIKIAIAREGLIIILLLLFAGLSLIASEWVNSQIISYEISAQEIEPLTEIDKDSNLYSVIGS
jgi:hypothetical protein